MEKETYWLGHRERLRLRAEEQGFDELKPHEIVELILYYAVPRQDMTEVARNLINQFDTLQGLFRASRKELLSVPGMTPAAAEWIMMTGEMLSAYMAFKTEPRQRIFRFRDVIRFLVPRWREVHPPECWMIYTDFSDNLLTYTTLCDSLSWFEPEYMCQVVREALALGARHAVLVCFVGPLPLEAEEEDIRNLVAFSHTLRAIEVELLDCVLVGESGYYSLNMEGKLNSLREECEETQLHENYVRDE